MADKETNQYICAFDRKAEADGAANKRSVPSLVWIIPVGFALSRDVRFEGKFRHEFGRLRTLRTDHKNDQKAT